MTDQEPSCETGTDASVHSAGVTWGSPELPPGDAPPRSAARWWLSAAAFALWLCFLVSMALLRLNTTPQ